MLFRSHVILPGHQTMMALKHGGANALLALQIDGSEQLALTKDVQVDPIRRVIEHIDFVSVKRGEKVTVDVRVHVTGEAGPDTLVVTENAVVSVEAEATHIPEAFEVSVEGAEVGTQVLAKDLELPSGVTLLADEELLIVNVTEQISAEALEAELAEAEERAATRADGRSFLSDVVDAEDVAAIVARWTGIPVSRMLEGEVEKLVLIDRKSTRLNSSHTDISRMPSSA